MAASIARVTRPSFVARVWTPRAARASASMPAQAMNIAWLCSWADVAAFVSRSRAALAASVIWL